MMDGYSFMIERNRRLIEHERRLHMARIGAVDHPVEAGKDLRRDLLTLYEGLEGCGRSAQSQGGGVARPNGRG